MYLVYDNEVYTVDIIAEKGGYTTSLKQKSNIIGTGDTIEDAVQSLFRLLDVQKDFNEHHAEAPKVGKHEESKEVCAHIWSIIDPNTWKCTKCPGVIKWK